MNRLGAALLLMACPAAINAQAAVRPGEAGRTAVSSDSLPASIADAEGRAQHRINRAAIDALPSQDIPLPSVGGDTWAA